MKKIIVFLIFVTFVMGIYFVKSPINKSSDEYFYREDFDSMDRDTWYIGEWQTLFSAYDKVEINDGIVKLEIKDVDRGPFLLSKPFELKNGDIFSVKRRVKMNYANENFTGGLALFETNNKKLLPAGTNKNFTVFGNAVVLVEYVHSYDKNSIRPGNNVFRVLPRDWEFNSNYKLTDPIFDEWFEEELIYNTLDETIIYKINDQVYKVNSQQMQDGYIRLLMHGYGFDIGHVLEIDWIEIQIKK